MNRLEALKKMITPSCDCITCKGVRQLVAVAEAAKEYSEAHDGTTIEHPSMEAATKYVNAAKVLVNALKKLEE